MTTSGSTCPDLREILEDEAYFEEIVEGFDPRCIRRLEYQDATDEHVIEATAAWLWRGAGIDQPPPPMRTAKQLVTPKKIGRGESRALKVRFLTRTGAW